MDECADAGWVQTYACKMQRWQSYMHMHDEVRCTTITTFVLKYACSYVLSPFCNENMVSIIRITKFKQIGTKV
jgi:hypothetical protein